MSKSKKYLPKQGGASANTILIEGAINPTKAESHVIPLKITDEGILCVTTEEDVDNGFDIMVSGSEYISEDMDTRWDALKIISGSSAELKASSSLGSDLSSNGNFSTGTYIYADRGDVFYGDFIQVEVNDGLIMAYRKDYTEYSQLYTTDDEQFNTADGDVLLVK